MKKKAPKFFCENCGEEVKENAKICTHCGKFFTNIRCPKCFHQGDSKEFKNGCPECGYSNAKNNFNQKEELKSGDIIAFRSGKSVITHRIIEIKNDEEGTVLVTKGDNNNTEDRYPIRLEAVEGVFKYKIPKLGNFAMFLQTTVGTIVFISIPFIIFMIFDIAQRKKDNRIQKQRQEQLEKEIEELKKK